MGTHKRLRWYIKRYFALDLTKRRKRNRPKKTLLKEIETGMDCSWEESKFLVQINTWKNMSKFVKAMLTLTHGWPFLFSAYKCILQNVTVCKSRPSNTVECRQPDSRLFFKSNAWCPKCIRRCVCVCATRASISGETISARDLCPSLNTRNKQINFLPAVNTKLLYERTL